jgi:hypothetical protein
LIAVVQLSPTARTSAPTDSQARLTACCPLGPRLP